jgi:hypothetical protein
MTNNYDRDGGVRIGILLVLLNIWVFVNILLAIKALLQ